jgi:hypothetical protein
MYILLIVGGCVVALLLAWPYIKTWLPASWQGTATGMIDTVAGYADETAAGGLLGGAALLFKKHGDTESVAQIGVLWGKAMAWDDKPVAVVVPPVATPSIETLAADVAILRAVIASQSTSTIPPSVVNNG